MGTSTRIRAGCAWALILALGLSACGSSDTGTRSARQGTKSQRVVKPGQRSLADMVAAVSVGKAGPPVEVKFELREPPQVGKPVNVDIAVVADAPAIDRLYGKFSVTDGIELVAGDELEAVDKPAPGTVIRHVVQIVPKQDGIFTLSATVGVDLPNDSMTRAFTIPIIVGVGLADTAAAADTPR